MTKKYEARLNINIDRNELWVLLGALMCTGKNWLHMKAECRESAAYALSLTSDDQGTAIAGLIRRLKKEEEILGWEVPKIEPYCYADTRYWVKGD